MQINITGQWVLLSLHVILQDYLLYCLLSYLSWLVDPASACHWCISGTIEEPQLRARKFEEESGSVSSLSIYLTLSHLICPVIHKSSTTPKVISRALEKAA